MKKTILILAIANLTVFSYGQGFVTFNNNNGSATPAVIAPITDSDGTTRVGGAAYYAQCYAADGANASSNSLTAKGFAVNLRTSANAGFFQTSGTAAGAQGSQPVSPSVAVTAANGGTVTIQVRVWSSTFATYEAALSAYTANPNGGVRVGASTPFNVASVAPPGTPADLQGLAGFSLQPIPEPSTIALGILGAGSLLFLRRKK